MSHPVQTDSSELKKIQFCLQTVTETILEGVRRGCGFTWDVAVGTINRPGEDGYMYPDADGSKTIVIEIPPYRRTPPANQPAATREHEMAQPGQTGQSAPEGQRR